MYGNLGLDRIVLYLMIHEIDFIAWILGDLGNIEVDEIIDKKDQSFIRPTLNYPGKYISIQASSKMPENYPFTIGYDAFF